MHIVDGDSAVGPLHQPVSAASFVATAPIEKMATVSYETCPTSAPFFGFMGVTAALCFASKCYAKNAGSIALSVPLRVFVRAMALRCCATPSLGFFPWLSSPLTWPGKKFVSMRCCCVLVLPRFCPAFTPRRFAASHSRCRHRCRVRHGEVRCRYRVHGCDEPWPRHEKHHSRGHGRCARHLRAHRRSHHPGLQ